jgi:hypothetical protein
MKNSLNSVSTCLKVVDTLSQVPKTSATFFRGANTGRLTPHGLQRDGAQRGVMLLDVRVLPGDGHNGLLASLRFG